LTSIDFLEKRWVGRMLRLSRGFAAEMGCGREEGLKVVRGGLKKYMK